VYLFVVQSRFVKFVPCNGIEVESTTSEFLQGSSDPHKEIELWPVTSTLSQRMQASAFAGGSKKYYLPMPGSCLPVHFSWIKGVSYPVGRIS
jgi:hypothetical protein